MAARPRFLAGLLWNVYAALASRHPLLSPSPCGTMPRAIIPASEAVASVSSAPSQSRCVRPHLRLAVAASYASGVSCHRANMLATHAIRMPDRSQEEHYQKMLMMYTHTHEQPESLGMVRAPTEYEESENEVLHLVDPPSLDRSPLPPSDPSPPSTGAAMLTSLLGRFSISRFLRPGPTICPKDLSPMPEAPLSPTHTKRNAVTPEAAPMLSSLLRGEPSLPSSFATDDGKGRKRRRYNDENDSDSGSGSESDWEPGVVARHRNNGSTRKTSRRNNTPRASAWRAPPKLTARDGKVLIRGASRGGRAPILESSRVLHPTQLEGGLPTGDFTFEKRLRPAGRVGHNIPSATFEHVAPASSRHSSMEVDDMAPSPVSDVSSSTLHTPPPTELQYPDTDVELEEDDITSTPFLPGVRRSKMTALLRLKQNTSPDPGTPYIEMSPDVEMGDDDADGAMDSDGDDGDDETDSDFAPPPTQAQPPRFRRKAEPATRQHKRDPRAGRKTTSRRRRHVKNPDGARRGYVTPKGEERQYAHPTDRERKQLRVVHGPIWCLFCTKTAPGPDDDGDFSRVKDSPKRHLLSCKRFRASQYYRTKAETGMYHERIVERAVREQKAAGSIIRCPKRAAQQARLAKEGFTHAKVRDELERLSTVYSDCKCCEFPHFSDFRQEP